MAARRPHMTRRGVLAAGAGGLAAGAAAAGCAPRGPLAEPSRPKVGLQLYTVREAMSRDVADTLREVADIGYDEVEFAGYFGVRPAELRALLDDLGLAAPATHVDPLAARDDPMSVIEPALEIGCSHIVIAWLPPDERETLDQWRAWADAMNGFAERCRAAGADFAYHNHDFEFAPVDGVAPMDLLLERCDPALVGFEIDFYWARAGGRDARTLLAAHPGRFPLCHVKDMDASGAMADVGAGVIDFAEILALPGAAGIRHHFVERDDAPAPLSSAQTSYAALSRILAGLAS